MKSMFISLLFLSLCSLTYAENNAMIKTSTPDCIDGYISLLHYNYDNTLQVLVRIDKKTMMLYTNRPISFPLILSAFVNKSKVIVFTTSCYNGGKFAEITFL